MTGRSYRLQSMPTAQCHVNIYRDENGELDSIELISYATRVLTIYYSAERDCYNLYCTGTYSRTTARHINRFTTEFCGKNMYHSCKDFSGQVRNDDLGFLVDYKPLDTVTVVNTARQYIQHGKPFYGRY